MQDSHKIEKQMLENIQHDVDSILRHLIDIIGDRTGFYEPHEKTLATEAKFHLDVANYHLRHAIMAMKKLD